MTDTQSINYFADLVEQQTTTNYLLCIGFAFAFVILVSVLIWSVFRNSM